jgi:hypothetical protein
MALLVTLTAASYYSLSDDGTMSVAISDMRRIQAALINQSFADLERIPCRENKGENPIFIPSYLTLSYTDWQGGRDPETGAPIKGLLTTLEELGSALDVRFVQNWDGRNLKGWRGPYLESNAGMDATYFDPELFPADDEGNHVHLPALETPWAADCEARARDAEKTRMPDLAAKLRVGKYYQILPARKSRSGYVYMQHLTMHVHGAHTATGGLSTAPYTCEVPASEAVIISWGADCLPGAMEYVMSNRDSGFGCESACRNGNRWYGICIQRMEQQCRQYCNDQYKVNIPQKQDAKLNTKLVSECGQECYDLEFPACMEEHTRECLAGCYADEQADTRTRLAVTDPADERYIDTGDDLILFVSNGHFRLP